VKSRVNEIAHPYAKHGFIHQGIHRMVSGQGSMAGPGVGIPLYNSPHSFFGKANNAVNALLGVGGHKGGLLHGFGLFHSGGVVPRYFAGGGPVGGDTVPGWLTPGEGVVTTGGMRGLGAAGLHALNNGQGFGGHITIVPGTVVLRLDNRTLARANVEYTLQRAARGPSSLVGGSLATGAAVTSVIPG
jgi:hypothetical protein